MLFVPKSLLDSSPPQVNPDTRGHSSLPAGKKYKIFPCYSFLTASRKLPACSGVPGASSVVGSSPRAGATVAACPVVGLSLPRFPVLFVSVFPFHADVQRETRHGVRCLQKQVQLGGVLGCGFTVRFLWCGWVTAQSSAVIVASSSFSRTKPNVVQGQKDSSSW